MLCQNCGRRSSDKRSFCSYCGAVGSPDGSESTMATGETVRRGPLPRCSSAIPQRTALARPSAARVMATSGAYNASRKKSGSGASLVVFLALGFAMAYWLTKSEDFDLIVFLRDAIAATLNQSDDSPRSNAVPATRPAPPPAARTSTPQTAPARELRTLMDLDGLSSDQVRQRLGPPMRTIAGGDGVTVWVYQNGALLVYFSKDRASLKPPR